MKKFLVFIILSLSFMNLLHADDINDFELEGIALGNSLLNFFNQNTIQSSRQYEYKDKTFYSVDIWSDKFKEFDAVQFHLKKNDKNYKIYGFSGAITFGKEGIHYPKSEKKCKIKQKEIENSINSLFPNADKNRHSGVGGMPEDPKVIRHDVYIVLNNGDVWLQCYTFSKKPKKELNILDNLRVTILSGEFKTWLNTKAY